MTKPKKEYRMVCARYGTQGHSDHTYAKKDKATALKAKNQADHHAETKVGANHFYRKEFPYLIQVRDVTKWEELT